MDIIVKYSCYECMLKNIEVSVPARENEDVRIWMDNTIHYIANDHKKRSPQCHPKQLHDLMIPISNTDRIGGPVTN